MKALSLRSSIYLLPAHLASASFCTISSSQSPCYWDLHLFPNPLKLGTLSKAHTCLGQPHLQPATTSRGCPEPAGFAPKWLQTLLPGGRLAACLLFCAHNSSLCPPELYRQNQGNVRCPHLRNVYGACATPPKRLGGFARGTFPLLRPSAAFRTPSFC